MKLRIVIPGELPTLNEIINTSKAAYGAYMRMKSSNDELVAYSCVGSPRGRIEKAVDVVFWWYRTDRRTDPDNVAAGQKFVFDGLVLANVLPGDGWKDVNSIKHFFNVDKDEPRVEVVITEVGEEQGCC